MTGPDADFERVYLKPAELCICRVPTLVTTILGSCVAVTMHHPKLGLAAICHALQATCSKLSAECPRHCEKKYQYVACVIPEMVHLLEAAGANREMLEVKLFGGAAVLRTVADQPIGQSIGRLNIEAAKSILARYGFDLKVHQVGGMYGRKIIFNTHTGEVKIKRIQYAESVRAITTGK
jgi:chemotaxis protein CheD